MIRVLVIKMSSMGDVIHTLPALTDAAAMLPGVQFDWVVESSFAEIPAWHPAVDRVIVSQIRQWRKNWRQAYQSGAIKAFLAALRERQYDYIIDAQGLIKSAVIAKLSRGKAHGLDHRSSKEWPITWAYRQSYRISRDILAVDRLRLLFSQALGYPVTQPLPDYGIRQHFSKQTIDKPYMVFLVNTTWQTKMWPLSYWVQLGNLANEAGYQVRLTSGNDEEKARIDRIAGRLADAVAYPRLDIGQVGQLLHNAAAFVAVDTGFAHLGAALAVPSITIYGATSPNLTGTHGENQYQYTAGFYCSPCLSKYCTHEERFGEITPPCYRNMTPDKVWQHLLEILQENAGENQQTNPVVPTEDSQ